MDMFLKRKLPILGAAMIAAIDATVRAQVSFSINLTQGQSAISPFIYGVNTESIGGDANQGLDQSSYSNLNLAFQRLGGDRWTAYNYTNNASNAGSDYMYENDNYLGGGSTPGGAYTAFLQGANAVGAGALITIPINGYVAADFDGPQNPDIPPQDSTHFVPEYPTQAQDPAPAANHVYENGAVQIAADNFASTPAVPLMIELDNEPELWNSTHPEVHPQPVTYAELMQDSLEYATMIKQVDPSAEVFGWGSYGWYGYTTLNNASDSAANGNFMNYYLSNFAAASAAAGTRLLDSLELHWYPTATGLNADGVATDITSDDISPGVVAARLQAPRSLWDPTYTETSGITEDDTHGPIELIPRTDQQIATYYPGTKLSFGEYNYGAGYDISGGIAEADVLGIFGKYGVYSASEYPVSNISDAFIDGAFQIFRNYDGKDSTFGDTEVQAINNDTVDTSVYASVDADDPDHLTVVAINKEDQTDTATINLADGPAYKTVAIYQLTSAGSTPQFAGDMSLTNSTSFTYSMPAYSVSMINFFVPGQTVGTWDISGTGKWGTLSDWSGAPPQTAGDTANFDNAITANATVRLAGNWSVGTMNFDSSKSYTIGPGSGGTLTLDNGAGNAAINDDGGSHSITATTVLNSNTIVTVVNPGDSFKISGAISGNGGLTVAGAGVFTLSGTNSYLGGTTVSGTLAVAGAVALPENGSLAIQSGGKVQLAAGLGPINIKSLSILGSGSLDIGNNELLIDYGSGPDPIASIAAWIKNGYYGLSGPAIISSDISADDLASGLSYGIGYADGADGVVAGLPSGEIEIMFTLLGDANLDGTVNTEDFTQFSANLGQSGKMWDDGDFNYDGTVNTEDFTLFSHNLGESDSLAAGGLDAANGVSVANVPEPVNPLLLMAFACPALGSRRRRSSKRGHPNMHVHIRVANHSGTATMEPRNGAVR
jgi:hypothetical protein